MKVPFCVEQLWGYRTTLFIILVPLLLLPLPLVVEGTESSCAYVIIVMALYWITEAIPLAVTAFIPVILFPMMGVLSADAVSKTYFPDTNWLLLGGLMISIAIEDSNLHKRIALRILLIFGAKPRFLMMGFMITSFFLSMWISNTATTAMMLPIVEAVFKELKKGLNSASSINTKPSLKNHEKNKDVDYTSFSTPTPATNSDIDEKIGKGEKNLAFVVDDPLEKSGELNSGLGGSNESVIEVDSESVASEEIEETKEMTELIKAITLCVPYSASIGGTATLTGTAPNLVLSGQFQERYPDAPELLSFGSWMGYCLPNACVALVLAYIWFSIWFFPINKREMKSFLLCGKKTESEEKAELILRREYRKLGSLRWHEGIVLFIFVLTVFLWFFREPGFMPGWGMIFKEDFIQDGTVATTMGFLFFILPRDRPEFLCNSSGNRLMKPKQSILNWKLVHEKMAWNVLFLLGGGFAMAEAATESGLSAWLGSQLEFFEALDPWLICLIVTIIVCLFTECSSNTATASLFVPILADLSGVIKVHPLYLMVGPVIASSMAFMLPAATPPNAIAFSYGRLKVLDMVKAGWMLNLLGIGVITLFINTYGVSYFGLNEYPSWADTNGVDIETNGLN